MCGHLGLNCLDRILSEPINGLLLWGNSTVIIPDHIRYLSAIFAIKHYPFSVEEFVRFESQGNKHLGMYVA
jgi:hypothetical protein